MRDVPQETGTQMCLGLAMAAEWRRLYPTHTTKHVAKTVGCTIDAAENLLRGSFSSASMGRIIAAYGAGWVAERVLEAAGTNLEQYIEKQAVEAEKAAAIAKAKARDARERLERFKASRRSCLAQDGVDADQNV